LFPWTNKLPNWKNGAILNRRTLNFWLRKAAIVRIYTAFGEQVKDIPQDDVVILRKGKNCVVFAHVTRSPVSLEGFEEFIIPDKSLRALKKEIIELLTRINEYKEKLIDCYALRPVLQQYGGAGK
jgi:hypothetical protein